MIRKNEKGFSYLEIMISLMVIGVVIVPVGSAMVNATQTQIKAKTLYDATKGAEMLIQEIEMKLDCWIRERISMASLEQGGLFAGVSPGQGVLNLVETFALDEKKYGMASGESKKGLIYDVAIWELGQVAKGKDPSKEITISFSQPNIKEESQTVYLDEAIRLSSMPRISLEEGDLDMLKSQEQMNLEYRFKPGEERMIFEQAQPLKEGQEFFSGSAVLEVTQKGKAIQVTQKNYTGIKHDEKADFKIDGKVEENWTYNESYSSPLEMVEYTFLPVQGESQALSNEELVIFLDTSRVVDEKVGIIKLVNETGRDVIVKKIGRVPEAVVIMPEAKKGNISIQKDTTYGVTANYVIGIVIRDKAQSGKIVKKMIGLYAYD